MLIFLKINVAIHMNSLDTVIDALILPVWPAKTYAPLCLCRISSVSVRKLRIWSHLLKKCLMQNCIICAMKDASCQKMRHMRNNFIWFKKFWFQFLVWCLRDCLQIWLPILTKFKWINQLLFFLKIIRKPMVSTGFKENRSSLVGLKSFINRS